MVQQHMILYQAISCNWCVGTNNAVTFYPYRNKIRRKVGLFVPCFISLHLTRNKISNMLSGISDVKKNQFLLIKYYIIRKTFWGHHVTNAATKPLCQHFKIGVAFYFGTSSYNTMTSCFIYQDRLSLLKQFPSIAR